MTSFCTNTRIQGSQCGHGGLLQPSRYFELINHVIERWFAEGLELSFAELHFQRRIGIPTGQLGFCLHSPITLGQHVGLQLSVVRLGSRTIELHIECSNSDMLCFEARLVLVMVDLSQPQLKGYAIPQPLRARLQAFSQ